jgi:hypothetical protein
VNEGDLQVTALSLRFATTALREQPASAPIVCDKVRHAAWAVLPVAVACTRWRSWRDAASLGSWLKLPPLCFCPSRLQMLPQAIALVMSPLLQGGCVLLSLQFVTDSSSVPSCCFGFCLLCSCLADDSHPCSTLPCCCPCCCRLRPGGPPVFLPGPGQQRRTQRVSGGPAGAAHRGGHRCGWVL